MKRNAWFEQLYKDKLSDRAKSDLEIADKIEARLYPQQRDFVKDPSLKKAALCPRRAGKSYSVLSYALITALRKPGSTSLIIGKVRKQVKKVYWQTLKKICKDMELRPHYRNMELECELPNGSIVYFAGADNIEEIEKFRGPSYDLCCVDEGKSYSPTLLKELVIDVLKPALNDRRGTLIMIGTPGAIPIGPFYEVTSGVGSGDLGMVRRWADRDSKPEANWSLHAWSARDIVEDLAMKSHPGYRTACNIWYGALEDKRLAGWADDHPTWRREYLGEWVADEDALVYHFYRHSQNGELHYIPDENSPLLFGLDPGHSWEFVLGLDLGSKDDTSFVIAAWADTCPDLVYVHAEKHIGWQIGDIVERTGQLEELVGGFHVKVADTGGLGKMVVESMAAMHGVNFIPAIKSEKPAHIKLLNSDFDAGRILVDPEGCRELIDEWYTLQWLDEFHTKEDPRNPNHCADAALYIWRYCYHHLWQARIEAPTPGSPAWWKQREDAEERALQEQVAAEATLEGWQLYENQLEQAPTMDSIWTPNWKNLRRS